MKIISSEMSFVWTKKFSSHPIWSLWTLIFHRNLPINNVSFRRVFLSIEFNSAFDCKRSIRSIGLFTFRRCWLWWGILSIDPYVSISSCHLFSFGLSDCFRFSAKINYKIISVLMNLIHTRIKFIDRYSTFYCFLIQ